MLCEEQQRGLERGFRGHEAALERRFSEERRLLEQRLRKKAFYVLRPLREEVKAAEEQAEAKKRRLLEEEQARKATFWRRFHDFKGGFKVGLKVKDLN